MSSGDNNIEDDEGDYMIQIYNSVDDNLVSKLLDVLNGQPVDKGIASVALLLSQLLAKYSNDDHQTVCVTAQIFGSFIHTTAHNIVNLANGETSEGHRKH